MLNLGGQYVLIPSLLSFTAKELFQLKQFGTLNRPTRALSSLPPLLAAPFRALDSKLFVSISSTFLYQTNCPHLFSESPKSTDFKSNSLSSLCVFISASLLLMQPSFSLCSVTVDLRAFWLLHSLHHHIFL